MPRRSRALERALEPDEARAGDEVFSAGDIRRAIIAGVDLGMEASDRAYGAVSKMRTLVIVEMLVGVVLLALIIFFARDVYDNRKSIEANTAKIDDKAAYWDSLVEDIVDARLRIAALESEVEKSKEK
jgi:cell division protein FtsL